jgi:hypothetical protein
MDNINYIASEANSTLDENNNSVYTYDIDLMDELRVNEYTSNLISQKSVMSLEEIFCPYTTVYDSGSYMPIANIYDRGPLSGFDINGNSIQIIPNPGSGYSRQEVTAFDIASGLNYGLCPTFADVIGSETPDDYTPSYIQDKNDISGINSIALRTPMMMAGFGYTTEGFPFPSQYDNIKRYNPNYVLSKPLDSGNFPGQLAQFMAYSGLWNASGTTINYQMRQFIDNPRGRVDQWKAGPLDVRWDEGKNMFVAAPEVFVGYAKDDIPAAQGRFASKTFTSGEIEVYTGKYDMFGVINRDKVAFPGYQSKLLIINRSIDKEIPSGTLVIAIRTNNGEYMPIWADCDADLGS